MLNYDTSTALINAFTQGAKFKITGPGEYAGPVKRLVVSASPNNVVAFGPNGQLVFKPNGEHLFGSAYRLVRDESLAALLHARIGELERGKAPFLQQFVTGTPAYCPKTGEVVDSIVFREGELEVGLVLGGKVLRKSTNYRHDGSHKHDPARSLKLGTPPPPAKPDVTVPVYLFESKKVPGKFIALTQADLAPEYMWRQVGFGNVVAQGKQRG